MDFLASFAESFIGMFQAGGDVFMGFVTGIIPLLVALMLSVTALTKLIGEQRVHRFMQMCTKFTITRYTLIPFFSAFFLTNPMCYTFGRFLNEKHKAAYYDATVSLLHPIVGLFPHANPAEAFVYLGIAQGFAYVGNMSELAIRFLLTGLVVILVRGIITEKLYTFIAGRSAVAQRN